MVAFACYQSSAAVIFFSTVQSTVTVFLLLFCYGLSVLPLCYLYSMMFENHSTAQISIMAINFASGFVAVVAYFVMSNIPSKHSRSYLKHTLAYIHNLQTHLHIFSHPHIPISSTSTSTLTLQLSYPPVTKITRQPSDPPPPLLSLPRHEHPSVTKYAADHLVLFFRFFPTYLVGEGLIGVTTNYFTTSVLGQQTSFLDWNVAGKLL